MGVVTGNPLLGIAVYSGIASSGQGGNYGVNFARNGLSALGVMSGNPFLVTASILAVASSSTAQLGGSVANGIAQGLGYASMAFAAVGAIQEIGGMIAQASAARTAAQNAATAQTLGLSTEPYYTAGDLSRAFNNFQTDVFSKVAAIDKFMAIANKTSITIPKNITYNNDASLKGLWSKEFMQSYVAESIKNAPPIGLSNTAHGMTVAVSTRGMSVSVDPTQLVGSGFFFQTRPSNSPIFMYAGLNEYLSIGMTGDGAVQVTAGLGLGSR